jgi:HEAT repeat protein
MGLLRHEPFFEGKPSSYWRDEIVSYVLARDSKNNVRTPRIKILFWDLPDWVYPSRKKLKTEGEKPAVLSGKVNSIPVLIKLLEDPDENIAMEAGRSLARFTRNSSVVVAFQKTVMDDRYSIRYCAATGLLRVAPDKDNIELVRSVGRKMSKDANQKIREAGATLLVEAASNSPNALEDLIALLKNETYADFIDLKQLKAAVEQSIGLTASPSLGQAVRVPASTCGIDSAFLQIGDRAIPSLRELLNDPNALVRSEAALVLGMMGSNASLVTNDLAQLLHDKDPGVRYCAVIASENIGISEKDAIRELIRVLIEDPEELVRQAAASSLGKLSNVDRTGIAALETASKNDTSAVVRSEADQSLLRLKPPKP